MFFWQVSSISPVNIFIKCQSETTWIFLQTELRRCWDCWRCQI